MNVTAAAAADSFGAAQPPARASSGIDSLASEQTFLKLFVAQLRNQDPLSPQDGIQFIAQLAQFSNLEQSLQMRQDLDAIRAAIEKLAQATPTTPPAASS